MVDEKTRDELDAVKDPTEFELARLHLLCREKDARIADLEAEVARLKACLEAGSIEYMEFVSDD